MKQGFAYLLTNFRNTVFYTGVTADLVKRINDHKQGFGSIFTSRYKLTKLVYYEFCESMLQAIIREKQIKNMSRIEKIVMIKKNNPTFKDLYPEIKQDAYKIPDKSKILR